MGNLPLSAVDIVVVIVLLGSAGFAFMRGFVHEVLSIAAWVAAILAALYGFGPVRPFFQAQIGPGLLADAATGASLFLVTLLLMSFATRSLSARVRSSALNSVDSALGFLFGLLRGILILCLSFIAISWLYGPEEKPEWLAGAKTRPWLERGAAILIGLAPEGLAGDAAKAASAEAERARDIQKAFETLSAPLPSLPGDKPQPGAVDKGQGYDPGQRKELDRLFQSNQ